MFALLRFISFRRFLFTVAPLIRSTRMKAMASLFRFVLVHPRHLLACLTFFSSGFFFLFLLFLRSLARSIVVVLLVDGSGEQLEI